MRGAPGFSLLELLAVLALMSVLALGVMPLAEVAAQRQKEQALREGLWQIRAALDAYKLAVDAGELPRAPGGSGYPPDLQTLVRGVPGRDGRPLRFLRRLPRDPFAPAGLPPEASWAQRSYASDPEQPGPGEDVYDVMSSSPRVGSNGVPLKDW